MGFREPEWGRGSREPEWCGGSRQREGGQGFREPERFREPEDPDSPVGQGIHSVLERGVPKSGRFWWAVVLSSKWEQE